MFSVAHNPWLTCALVLTARVIAVGGAWGWVVRGPGRLQAAATAVLLGVAGNALGAMALAEAGWYTPAAEAAVLAAMVLAGWRLGRARVRPGRYVPVAAATFGVVAAMMLVPRRGEWIAGGWDPGIYVDQGVAVAREGDFTPPPDRLLAELGPDGLEAFTRSVHNYREYLPVMPVDLATSRIHHFFFRLTPSWIAVLYRSGGLRAATRVNHFTAWPVLLLLAALFRSWNPRPAYVLAGLAIVLLHPVWLFMLSFPTSEMLQLMLVLGVLVVRPHSAGAAAVLLFAAVANRFSFFPFAGLLLCAMAWAGGAHDSWPARLRLAGAGLAGVLYDYAFCRVTIGRLDELVAPLLAGGLVLGAVSLAVGDRARRVLTARVLAGGLLAGAAAFLAADIATGAGHVALRRNLADALPFLGPLLGLAALAGAALWGRFGRHRQAALLFLAAATLATLTVAAITPLYPWALRRHLVYTLPLLAALSAALFDWGWQRTRRPAVRGLLLAGLAAVIAANGPRAIHALVRTEFDGLSATLADGAGRLLPGDVVVADHFRWGTPLKMIHGADVLNGEVLWNPSDMSPERTASALRALAQLHRGGRRVVLFTSTDQGPAVFPGDWGPTTPIWSAGPGPVRDLHHDFRQTDFVPRERIKVFALHLWRPPAPPPPPPADANTGA